MHYLKICDLFSTSLMLNMSQFSRAVDTLRQDTLFLSRTPPVPGIVRARGNNGFDPVDHQTGATWEKRLQEIFAAFALAHPDYFQIRYIGVADGGREIVRVDLANAHAITVPPERLQRKGDRDYYRKTLSLRDHEVYLSDIDLNQEYGRVALPPVPTLRAATPVFDGDGRMFGMVVINMDVDRLLKSGSSGLPAGVEAYIANMDGDYLYHPDPTHTFGFDLGRRHLIQQDYPPLAALLDGKSAERRTLNPIRSAAGTVKYLAAQRVHFDPHLPERYLLLAYAIPESAVAQQIAPARREALAGALGSTVLVLLLVLLILNRMLSPLRRITEAARAIADGRYDVRLPQADGGEIGELANALQTMQSRVSEREHDYQELNDQLERRVEERTAQLAANEAELTLAASVFHNTVEGVMITDAEATILSVNPAFSEITGFAPDEVIGRKPNVIRSDHHDPEFYRSLWQTLLREGRWQGEIWNRRKNGEAFLEWLSISMVAGRKGKAERYVAVFDDITDMRRKDEHIRHQAFHDALTGLPNRALLLDRLEHGIGLAWRDGTRLGVMFIDLDRFKGINDTLGHDVGDSLLQEVSRRLGACMRSTDTVARMGGDEFVVLMERVEELEACATLAEKILAVLSKPMDIATHHFQVSASVGIACFPDDGEDAVTLMKHADTAMYSAKAAGRNAFRFFQPAMTEKAKRRLELEMELRKATGNGELELFYQPKIDLAGDMPCGMEALVRWRHPNHGLVPPMEFIPIAEETGLIDEIGDWVLEEACRQWSEWRDKGMAPLPIAVNVSAKQLLHGDLIGHIGGAIRRHGIPPSGLEIELTESVIMANPEQAAEMFGRLHDLGVTVAMDDFGTGYSSLAYLRRLPIDVLKIDRSFVMDAVDNDEDAQIVKTILALGQTLKLKVVAEGIETRAQAEFLRSGGCAIGQGYLYSRPLPAPEMERWLKARVPTPSPAAA